jgi:hypothetical protein
VRGRGALRPPPFERLSRDIFRQKMMAMGSHHFLSENIPGVNWPKAKRGQSPISFSLSCDPPKHRRAGPLAFEWEYG